MELLSFDALTMHLILIRRSYNRGYVNTSIIQQLAIVKVIYDPSSSKCVDKLYLHFFREKNGSGHGP